MALRASLALSAHLFAREPLRFDHLKDAAEAGFRRIELWAMTPHLDVSDPSAIRTLERWLDDLSLSASSLHAPFYADLSEAKKGRWLSLSAPDAEARAAAIQKTLASMRALRPLGARVAVLHPGAPGKAGEKDSREALEESLARLLPAAEALDAVLAIENIPAALGRAEPLARFVEDIDHPRLKICIDAGHALITEGERVRQAVERLAPLCAAVHLHDNDGRSDAHLIPGEGALAWRPFFAALDARGYRGPLAFELKNREESHRETLAALARAVSALSLRDEPLPA